VVAKSEKKVVVSSEKGRVGVLIDTTIGFRTQKLLTGGEKKKTKGVSQKGPNERGMGLGGIYSFLITQK